MHYKRNGMLSEKKQINHDTFQVQQQFDGSLQHENPVKRFGLVSYGFHYPIMGCASYQPYEYNTHYTSRKIFCYKNRRKKYLRDNNRYHHHYCGDTEESFLVVCHFIFQIWNILKRYDDPQLPICRVYVSQPVIPVQIGHTQFETSNFEI